MPALRAFIRESKEMEVTGYLGRSCLLFQKVWWISEREEKKVKGIWWIKRDFRISDNQCLATGLDECEELLPFFCWENGILSYHDYSAFHLQAQWQALNELRKSLRVRGCPLLEECGEVIEVLENLRRRYRFEVLYSHQETGNLVTYDRDLRVAEWCKDRGVRWREFNASSVLRGGNADRRRVKLRQVDYRRQKTLSIPSKLKPPSQLPMLGKPSAWNELVNGFAKFNGCSPMPSLQKVSEREAWKTLESFLHHRGQGYSGGISSPNEAFMHGSRLSPHLAWGTISLRTVFQELDRRILKLKEEKTRGGWLRSLRAFQSRLHWRDHFIQRLEAFPRLEELPLNPAYQDIPYREDHDLLQAWLSGHTGFPMVDACMRCLSETGFLNFRMRAMVVSFACFGLHLSWRFIHPPLAQRFLDYEPGIHLSQLQMQAGVIGFNTLRVYSPKKQFIDQDPDGVFVRKWIPELRDCATVEIAEIENHPVRGYDPAIIRLSSQAKDMKERIYEVRRSAEGRQITSSVLQTHGSRKRMRSKKNREPSGQMALFKI